MATMTPHLPAKNWAKKQQATTAQRLLHLVLHLQFHSTGERFDRSTRVNTEKPASSGLTCRVFGIPAETVRDHRNVLYILSLAPCRRPVVQLLPGTVIWVATASMSASN
jgi:hypothetical protein